MTNSTKYKLLTVAALILVGIVSRWMPHAWNFTPVIAIVLFASANLGVAYATGAVIVLMFVSDISLGFYDWHVMLAVYGSFIFAGIVGLLIRKRKSVAMIGLGTIGSSVMFYLVTNWAVWQYTNMYEHSFSGLAQSYVMALPFFRNAITGDIFYAALFFGAYALIERYVRRTCPKISSHTA